jgi:hypothetical protein
MNTLLMVVIDSENLMSSGSLAEKQTQIIRETQYHPSATKFDFSF